MFQILSEIYGDNSGIIILYFWTSQIVLLCGKIKRRILDDNPNCLVTSLTNENVANVHSYMGLIKIWQWIDIIIIIIINRLNWENLSNEKRTKLWRNVWVIYQYSSPVDYPLLIFFFTVCRTLFRLSLNQIAYQSLSSRILKKKKSVLSYILIACVLSLV